MAGLVLTDASPLIGLARVEGLMWLRDLFGAVWWPAEVRAEVLTGQGLPGESAVAPAESAGWLRLTEPAPALPGLPDLDEGEAACIRIALAYRSRAADRTAARALLLMDERAGRHIAMEHGLRAAGTAAVIGMAKSRGLIVSAREVFSQLHAKDFRIAPDVIATVLRRVGER
jgi:predicted nucleic acid-binding protein